MEDQVLAGSDPPLLIANFQRERFYRQEAHRYRRIAQKTDQLYVLAAPETDFKNSSELYETVAFDPDDGLSQEWHLVAISRSYATCLICQDRSAPVSDFWSAGDPGLDMPAMDQARRFEGIWTFDRQVSCLAAELLLNRILSYRPELAEKIAIAREQFLIETPPGFHSADPEPFAQRLVTYLQVGQYKLLKTYRSLATQERKERLVNSISTTIRQSLNPAEIFQVAVRELGIALGACRCLIYRCKATDETATIGHEFLGSSVSSLAGQNWPLQNNPLFQEVVRRREGVWVEDAQTDSQLAGTGTLALVQKWEIGSWLMVPVLYQNQLVGIVELHYCGGCPHQWDTEELRLVDAIATQVGVAIIQAEAYANLEELNEQLEALDRTRSNLIAITGHELRTPLSTIQICLESLASEPDMPPELRQAMLNSALADADRLRKLVQDFLTLSRLESGRVDWNLEPLHLQECVDLALSSVRANAVLWGKESGYRRWWLLALAILAVVPYLTSSRVVLDFVIRLAAFGVFATSLNILVGYGGMVSFGHALFFGGGAYAFGLMMQRTAKTNTLFLMCMKLQKIVTFLMKKHGKMQILRWEYFGLTKICASKQFKQSGCHQVRMHSATFV